MEAFINGINLHYEDHGHGLPVILLHGFPLTHEIWQPQIEALQNECRVITPDLRGHGKSEAPGEVYTMAGLADDIAGLIKHLNCGPAIIAGHSMGGYVAFAFYRRYADLVKGQVLVSTRAAADTPEGKANREAMAQRAEHERSSAVAVEKMLPNMMSPASLAADPSLQTKVDAMMAATSFHGIAGAQRGMASRSDSSDLLQTISVPTLIIAGTADALIPPVESQNMAQAIHGAELQLLDDAGHLPSLEKPHEFTAALQHWLRRQFAQP
ncbi:alpha/beta hydrolase [bacterium]|nr:alpha/beta hydrolase [bacterium]